MILAQKHLAPYLDHALTLIATPRPENTYTIRLLTLRPRNVWPRKDHDDIQNPIGGAEEDEGWGPLWFDYPDVRPQMRPWSHLGKTIYENGHPICVGALLAEYIMGVPMYLRRGPFPDSDPKREGFECCDFSCMQTTPDPDEKARIVRLQWKGSKLLMFLGMEYTHNTFDKRKLSGTNLSDTMSTMPEVLLRYNFDIFGLIEAGLADELNLFHEPIKLYPGMEHQPSVPKPKENNLESE